MSGPPDTERKVGMRVPPGVSLPARLNLVEQEKTGDASSPAGASTASEIASDYAAFHAFPGSGDGLL